MFLVLNLGSFVATEGLGEVSVFPSGVMEVIEKAELLVEGEWKLRFSLPLKSLNFIFFSSPFMWVGKRFAVFSS
jgi:hypothetical protein